MEKLPNSLQTQYAELLQNCVQPLSDGANLSFKPKEINGKRYWYLYISIGKTRREHYLGEESTALLDRIDDEKALWASNADDRELRGRLVAMLVAGGMKPLSNNEGKVLTLVERNGVFLAGAALIGTLAFRAYANMLGVSWDSARGTQDVDIAVDHQFALALPRNKKPINLEQLILDSDLGFMKVPTLNAKQPSTSFKIRGQDFRIDVLAPMRGRETSRPIELKEFNTFATPLRGLDYLLEDIQPAVLLYRHGVMVNVPAPGRFAVHKCYVSQKRPAAEIAKARKDLQQAAQVFRALLDVRTTDIKLAFDALEGQSESFNNKMQRGLAQLDADLRDAINAVAND